MEFLQGVLRGKAPLPLPTREGQGPKPKARLEPRGVIRVLAYCLVVSLLLGTVAARSAYGDWKESALGVGRQLSQFGDLEESVYRLRLNGERVFVASTTSKKPVNEVLDRFERGCGKHAAGLAGVFEDLPTAPSEPAETTSGFGTIREQSGRDGVVACLAHGGDDGWASLAARLRAFSETGDLAKVGDLRYAYAKATASGGSHVVTVWTEGPFRIASLAPPDGEEPPGSDSANAPRPERAVRLLTAEVEGAPYAIRIYDSAMSQRDVLELYDEQMSKRGWTPIPFVRDEVKDSRAYSRNGVDLAVFAYAEGDRSFVSVLEMRPR